MAKQFNLTTFVKLSLAQIAAKDKAFIETLTFPALYPESTYLPYIQTCGNGEKFSTLFLDGVKQTTLDGYDGEFTHGTAKELKTALKAIAKGTPTAEEKKPSIVKAVVKQVKQEKKVVLLAAGKKTKVAAKKKQ